MVLFQAKWGFALSEAGRAHLYAEVTKRLREMGLEVEHPSGHLDWFDEMPFWVRGNVQPHLIKLAF